MVAKYGDHYNKRLTPQSRAIPGTNQVENRSGGFVYEVDCWSRLDRFLILGTEGGTYYCRGQAGEAKLTIENAQSIGKCIKEDGIRTVSRIVEISDSGRAAKNDQALFALAYACAADNVDTRRAALEAIPAVARTGTHLFHFLQFVQGFRGWGRGLKRAIQNWYQNRPAQALAYQVVKYRQRDGWTHKDALRLSKPKPHDEDHGAIYHFITRGTLPRCNSGENLRVIEGHLRAMNATTAKQVAGLVTEYGLPREALPTQFLKDPEVWDALLPGMPATALIRNLGNLSKCGLLKPLSDAETFVSEKLVDDGFLRKGRIHPIQVLAALTTYESGKSVRGSGSWALNISQKVVDALDEAFYKSFGYVEPTGKRWLLGLDISGSMSWGEVSGIPGLTPRKASAAMAMVAARIEKSHHFIGFTDTIRQLPISPKQRLDTVVRCISGLPMGRTDCAQPMIYAKANKIPVDVFVVYTDNDTWCGKIHPVQALKNYRQATGINSKLIVVSMNADKFSIADPKDSGMIDICGFDSGAPQIMSTFVGGLESVSPRRLMAQSG
jgi:60 kDa SS-A/Ro ribonucleoprotein